MDGVWFKRAGWLYVPVSVLGGLASLSAIGFCITVLIAIDRHAHSVSDTFYGVYPFFVSTFLLLDWLARHTGNKSGGDL